MRKGINISNSCEGKTSYTSLKDASRVASVFKGKKKMTGYKCDFCNGFHIGHTICKSDMKQPAKVKRNKVKLNPNDFELKSEISNKDLIIRISA